MSEWSYVVAAYALTWVGLAGYALYLHARARRAQRLLRDEEERGVSHE